MSILATGKKLIKVGTEYSAGSGISIDDGVISVTGEFGKTYSAGDNINIYEQDEQLYISSKDWEQDIANASANAYNEAVAQIPDPFDPSYISAQVGNKLDTTAFTAWQSGQYATDLQTVEGQINNKLDTSSFSDVSGSFLTAINIPESATWNEVSQAYEQASATYLTSVSIPESAVWQDVSTTVQSNSAQWAEGGGGGDEEVNSFVYDNSATILDVDTTYQQNSASYLTAHQDVSNKLDTTAFSTVSGDFLTAAPADMATTGDVAELAQTISETYQVKGDYLTTADSANFYPSDNPSGFITGVDLSNYYTKDETSGKEELSNAFASLPTPNTEAESYVTDNSASINGVSNVVQSNSSTWSDVTVYQSNSSTYLTAHQSLDGYATQDWVTAQGYLTEISIPESATWNEVSTAYQNNSGTYLTAVDLTPYQTIEGMTAYQPVGDYATTADLALKQDALTFDYDEQYRISAINNSAIAAGDEFPVSADEAIQYVQTNSAGIDETVNEFQTNSSTYMVEPNLEYNAVNEISGYNGSAIAQYGAEKQWLVHDDTLVHESNSAQYALGCNISALQRLMGVDETVLWEGSKGSIGDTIDLSEPISSFNKVKFQIEELNADIPYHDCINNTNGTLLYPYFIRTNSNSAQLCGLWTLQRSNNDTRLTVSVAVLRTNGTTTGVNANKITKIIGIGRKN